MGSEWNCHREALNMGALGGSVWSWLGQEVSQGTWELTLPSLFPGADKQVCKECTARAGSCSGIPAPTSRRWSLFSRSFILWDDSWLSCQEGRGFQRGRQPPTRPSVCTDRPGSLATRVFPGWPQGGDGEPGLTFRPSGQFLPWGEHWTESQKACR